MIIITHIITDLEVGGAETMLYKLLSRINREKYASRVISLTVDGPVGDQIRALGIPVKILGMKPNFPNPLAALKLSRWLSHQDPDLIQTWMYHADLVGGIAAVRAGGIPIIWGIHHTASEQETLKPMTRWVIKLNAFLSSSLPASIVCCAEATRRTHIMAGYGPNKMRVIFNGFDLDRFKPDQGARRSIRDELNLPDDTRLVGLCARFHPTKDHETFIRAAKIVHARFPEVHFLLCGAGVHHENQKLKALLGDVGLEGFFHLLGRRQDMPRVLAALDVTVSSSRSEAFPQVVGESMTCGTPCVVTDVGDSALIVGSTGRVVPPKHPTELAEAVIELLALPQAELSGLGESARERMKEKFNLPNTVAQYEALYREVNENNHRSK